MESERWRQIESLYYTALERDAAERAAFLMEACAGDGELRREQDAHGSKSAEKSQYPFELKFGDVEIAPDKYCLDPYFESAGVDVKMLGKLWQYRYGDDEGVYFGEESQLGEPCDDSDLDIPSHLLSFR